MLRIVAMLLSELDQFLYHDILVLRLFARRQMLQLVLHSVSKGWKFLGLILRLNSLVDVRTHLLVHNFNNHSLFGLAMMRAGRKLLTKILLVFV